MPNFKTFDLKSSQITELIKEEINRLFPNNQFTFKHNFVTPSFGLLLARTQGGYVVCCNPLLVFRKSIDSIDFYSNEINFFVKQILSVFCQIPSDSIEECINLLKNLFSPSLREEISLENGVLTILSVYMNDPLKLQKIVAFFVNKNQPLPFFFNSFSTLL